MACVILPSETARLVYGYLVKENLNEIALQFLENSPYLNDCCQIVKNGYQFNTKLMNKDLQELVQEYSVIHNLVNNKVSLLLKTSLLYKRIKLKCESLSEILELILFWKYRNSRTEEVPSQEKTEKSSNSQTVDNCEFSNSNIISKPVSISANLDSSFSENNTNHDTSVPDFHSKLCCETYSKNEELEPAKNNPDLDKDDTPEFMGLPEMDSSENDRNVIGNNGNKTPPPQINSNANILTIDLNTPRDNAMMNEITGGPLESNEVNEFESQIKIVGIEEENHHPNHPFSVYGKSLGEEGNMNLDNGSVVFVGPEVGNVTLSQDRNQIIVIPIDYYKAEDELQNRIDINNDKLLQVKEPVSGNKNEIVFQEMPSVPPPSTNHLFEKSPNVDDNIITEKDFLKNKHLMERLEKELKKPEKACIPAPPQEPPPIIQSVAAAPLIVVSQTVVPAPKTTRYRTILPRKPEPSLNPLIVVQPLLEKNIEPVKTNSESVKKTENSRKTKKKVPNQKAKTKPQNILKSPIPETIEKVETSSKEEKTNEEKENCEKAQNKKIETPVYVMKKNSKRLSLSTPRRRNHIRALEFETPPKKGDEKKKSKTSPKIKVEQMTIERKSVRNTLFKSPIPEISLKSPGVFKTNKSTPPESKTEGIEPLNELSIPIATRSPNTKLSDAWESLTGVGCVIGQSEEKSPNKKMWDADLRCFIPENTLPRDFSEKKRIKKPEKTVKDNKKSTKKKVASTKKIKTTPGTVSPSKISLTAKRNTYSINGSEEGSPIRSLLDDLKLVTPFKDIETIRPTEETPLTKLLRENINTIDIDLSMINTPSFPPTPSIVITPELDDMSMTGANYYSPSKEPKDKMLKITDFFKVDPEKSTPKKESKEMHEKVIGDLVSRAKEIIGMGKESQEENVLAPRPSGKILSMVKIQMLTQCDKKLCENIPINEEANFPVDKMTLMGNLNEDVGKKNDLKDELEEKRKRALKKIKVVKENLSQKSRVTRGKKRKRSLNTTKSDKSKSDVSSESVGEKQTDDEDCRQEGIFHSTPNPTKSDSSSKIDSSVLDEIRKKFPAFQDNPEKYPGLTEKSRKKLHYVENFLKLPEIAKYLNGYDEKNPSKLFLKPSLRRFFQIFYKWLKHPHKRELNSSTEAKVVLEGHLSVFEKINKGLNKRKRKLSEGAVVKSDTSVNSSGNKHSDEEEKEWRKRDSKRRKEEDTEDGVVSTLPLKKRKSTVQQVEVKATARDKEDSKSCTENASQTQNFLQDIDVDRFLSQIHGQENR